MMYIYIYYDYTYVYVPTTSVLRGFGVCRASGGGLCLSELDIRHKLLIPIAINTNSY